MEHGGDIVNIGLSVPMILMVNKKKPLINSIEYLFYSSILQFKLYFIRIILTQICTDVSL